jgi:predicted AlkP superfamily pyrophosphatase or phosphodiesterase
MSKKIRSWAMWRVLLAVALLCSSAWSGWAAAPQRAVRTPPKLVVVLIIDQFRYDYLTRLRSQYTGGFARLWKDGAVFTNAHLQHFPTVTAVGHSTILTGAAPSLSGIAGNDWYDRELGRQVASVFDPQATLLGGGKGAGASPRRLLVSTVGDELKMAGKGASRVIGISLKDRAAILSVGRMANAAYWFDNATGNFISSTFYFPELPAWVKEFNAKRAVDKFAGAKWKSASGKLLKTLPTAPGPLYYDSLGRSPFGSELLISFAERAIEAEQLGARDATDLVSISLSSTDLVGHTFGPDSLEIRDLNIQTDRMLGQFFQYLDKRLRPGSVLVVFTADHGVAPLPEVQTERRMPGGRLSEATLNKAVEAALAAKYGGGRWVLYSDHGSFWLNRALIGQKNLKEAEVEECAAAALAGLPHVSRVYTRARLLLGQFIQDRLGLLVANGFCPGRSGDVIAVLEPYWIYGARDAAHGSAYSYDTHLPIIFMGPGIKPGFYDQNVAVNDIAPTLATILEVETPSGSIGRVLSEMLEPR